MAYFRDRMVDLEEQRNRYHQLYEKCIADEEQTKQIVVEKEDYITKLKAIIDTETAKY